MIYILYIFLFIYFNGYSQFGPQQIITTEAHLPVRVVCGDINGDGNIDVALAARSLATPYNLAWLENTNGNGDFGSINLIGTMSETYRINLADLDNDGDFDVMAANPFLNLIVWYKNLDGLGNFGPIITISNIADGAIDVIGADIDNDGDMDVFSASPADNELAWFENLDGLGNFGSKNIITNILNNAWTVFVEDLDNDGDMDVLSTYTDPFGGEIVWFENLDGQGSFGSKNIISTEVQFPRDVYAADIDNDGDMDVLSASQNDDKIAWYENMTIIGIDENQLNTLSIYPNPTKGLVFINSKTETIISITVFDILGKKVLQLNGNIQQLDISTLQSGMYFLRIGRAHV